MRCLLFVVAFFGGGIVGLSADEGPARQPDAARQAIGVGQLLVSDSQSGAMVRLNLARYHVNVVLQPPVALVQIDQSFWNPHQGQQEGTFVFNLPDGASVSRFAMYTTHTQLIEGELIDRARAASIYQSIVDRRRDPAILEQIGGNLFRMRVFPIPARDSKRILLDYTVPLVNGPLSTGPLSTDQARDAAPADENAGRYSFELPLMSDREPIADFAITGTIRGPTVAGSASCESHPNVKFEAHDEETVRFEMRQTAFRATTPFVVQFQQRPAAAVSVRSYVPAQVEAPPDQAAVKSEQPSPQCEFLATISPQVLNKDAPPRNAAPIPVDVLVLADTSAANAHPQALRKTVRAVVDSLRKTDRFQLGCVDVSFRPLSKDWTMPRSTAAEQELAEFNQEFFLGASDFEKSFKGVFRSLPAAEPGRQRWVIYVGDGTLPIGDLTPLEIHAGLVRALKEDVRFSAVLLGHDPAGRMLMDSLAASTGGRIFRIGGPGDLTEPLAWIGAGCAAPVKIATVEAEGVAADDLFVPPSWVPGSALYVYGRRQTAEPFKLKVTIERAGRLESFVWTLEPKNDPADLFVGRLWAQQKLDQLRGLETKKPNDAATRARQVDLSQEWTLLNPSTAFLVLENEEDYQKYGVRRSLRHRYWKPDEAVAASPLAPLDVVPQKTRPTPRPLTPEKFEQSLADARDALKNSAPERALALLKGVEESPLAKTTREFSALREAARSLLARAELFERLGPRRGWFDRARPIGFPSPTRDLVWQFVYGYGSTSLEAGSPGALFKPIPPPTGKISLEQFVDWVKDRSGLNVFLDKQRLTDEGIALDQPVAMSLHGVRSMTLQSMLKHVLAPLQLTFVVENDLLRISTTSWASERLDTRVYPVGDLIQSTRAVPYSLLSNAELDRELLTKHRLEQKFDRTVSVKFNDLPLECVFDYLGEQIDDNIVVDRPTLTDEGVALDQPITLDMHDVPVRQILKIVLEPVQLTYVVENEAIVITTSTRAGEKLETRIHAAQDIVYDLPLGFPKKPSAPKPFFNGGGWMRRGWLGGGWMGGGGIGGAGMGLMGGGFFGGSGAGMMGGMGGGGAGVQQDSSLRLSELSESEETLLNSEAAESKRERPSAPGKLPVTNVKPESPASPADRSAPLPADTVPAALIPADGADRTNAGEMIDVIQYTVQPDAWESLSGPGSITYFPGALGFVVRQSQSIHEELAELLDNLRNLPPSFGGQTSLAPARVPIEGTNDRATWDPAVVVDLLKTMIQPDSWEDLMGPGSVVMLNPKLTLVVRQTPAVHEEIRNMLTSLRRARYLARRGRIWNAFGVASGPWFPIALGVTDLPPAPAESAAPAPDPAELAALQSLAEPIWGEQTWRSTGSPGRPGHMTTIRIAPERQEYEIDGRMARVEGEEAAIAYPGLSLVECGAWGTPLRRIVDGRLPWLPHRSRRELVQMFAVTVVAQTPQTVQFKLALPDAAPGDDIAVTVDRKTGLPTLWESRLSGQTVLRLRFEDLRQANGKPLWAKIIAEDSAGRQIERWDLIGYSELKSEIPALDRRWQNWAVLDVRVQDGEEVPPLVEALQSIRTTDGEKVDRALAAALARQPGQPLVSFLKAWNLAQRPKNEDEIVALLTDVARSSAVDLIHNMADGAFLHLSARGMYAVLLAIPEERRTAFDWDHLANMGARAGRPFAAIEHVKSAIAAAGPEGETPQRVRMLVQLLVDTNQLPAAVHLAQTRVVRDDIAAEDIPALADIFSRGGAAPEARKLIAAALAHSQTTDSLRQRLLEFRAGLESGIARWRTLVEAASLLPAGSSARHAAIDQLIYELMVAREVGLAGSLAEGTKDPQIAVALWLAQLDHEVQQANQTAAADLGWKLYQAQQLPDDRIDWLIARLHAARQHERVIVVVEDRLRAGAAVGLDVVQTVLATAYDAAGRKDAAARARTQPESPPNNRPPRGMMRDGMGGGFFSVGQGD